MALTRAKLEELIESGEIEVGGGLSNPMPDTTLITNLNADLIDGRHATWAHQNLLYNWDFRFNPVNQRAASGNITSSVFFYDRWFRDLGTITIAAGYLNLQVDAAMNTSIKGNALSGAVVTVSVMLGNVVYSGTGTFPTSTGTVSVTIAGFGTALLIYTTGYMGVRFTATTSTRKVQAVKLELGTVSTLAYDAPMEYEAELTKCQRYCINLSTYASFWGYCLSTTIGIGRIPLPVTMQGAITSSTAIGGLITVAGVKPITVDTFSNKNNSVEFVINGTGFTANTPANGSLGEGAIVLLYSDL